MDGDRKGRRGSTVLPEFLTPPHTAQPRLLHPHPVHLAPVSLYLLTNTVDSRKQDLGPPSQVAGT